MKYKKGDRVRVKPELKLDYRYFSENKERVEWVDKNMLTFQGSVVTIADAFDCWYLIQEDNQEHHWLYDMFECKEHDDIVEYFAKMGNSAEEIQRTYERYLWHIEKFEGLENKNKELEEEILDLSNTISELELVREELKNRISFLEKSLIELFKEKYNIER